MHAGVMQSREWEENRVVGSFSRDTMLLNKNGRSLDLGWDGICAGVLLGESARIVWLSDLERDAGILEQKIQSPWLDVWLIPQDLLHVENSTGGSNTEETGNSVWKCSRVIFHFRVWA